MAILPSAAMKMNHSALSRWRERDRVREGRQGREDSGETPGCFGVCMCKT